MADVLDMEDRKNVEVDLGSKNSIKWQTEIDLYRQFNTTLILEGNVNDKQLYINKEKGKKVILSLEAYLDEYLRSIGYEIVIFFNQVEGFYSICGNSDAKQANYDAFFKVVGNYKKMEAAEGGSDEYTGRTDSQTTTTNLLGFTVVHSVYDTAAVHKDSSKFPYCLDDVRIAMRNTIQPVAVVLTNVSRYIASPTNLSDADLYHYSQLYLASRERVVPKGKGVNNPQKLANILFMITDKANDIPAWFFLNNPVIRTINIPLPDLYIRKLYIESFYDDFEAEPILKGDDLMVAQKSFLRLTDGLKICELDSLQKLMNDNGISLQDISAGVSKFKHGVDVNPWEDPALREKLTSNDDGDNIKDALSQRVKGQPDAVEKAASIISSAVLGLTGITSSSSSAKPRGILFLAGPTGTGKTELAKSISNWVFGSDEHIVRFDMSEFHSSHTEARLFGAPPGYVGYEAGGELTGAVKRDPFSVLLFDEIEKANPTILDKFLQILEDGRLTDGKGETVFFNDSLIIFTSNLGMHKEERKIDQNGIPYTEIVPTKEYGSSGCNLPEGEEKAKAFKDYRNTILKEIQDFFKLRIQRPELLNRIGDNIIIFDFISKDAARTIADIQLNKLIEAFRLNKNIKLVFSEQAMETFYNELLKDEHLEQGGRGVGNVIESTIQKPLSNYMVENAVFEDATIEILDIKDIDIHPKLIVK